MRLRPPALERPWGISTITRAVGLRLAGRRVVAPVALADPPVDVVAVVLPVARHDAGGQLDRREPLARLVAVHRRDVQTGGSAVQRRKRLTVGLVGDQHIRRRACASVRLSVYLPSNDTKRTAVAPDFTPARSSRVRSRTPVQWTSGTRQPVTHWKSRVTRVGGIA